MRRRQDQWYVFVVINHICNWTISDPGYCFLDKTYILVEVIHEDLYYHCVPHILFGTKKHIKIARPFFIIIVYIKIVLEMMGHNLIIRLPIKSQANL